MIQIDSQANKSNLILKEDKNGCVILEDGDYCFPSNNTAGGLVPLKNVVHFLNSSGVRQPVSSIQQEACQSRGRFIFDLIEQLGGKKLSRKVGKSLYLDASHTFFEKAEVRHKYFLFTNFLEGTPIACTQIK